MCFFRLTAQYRNRALFCCRKKRADFFIINNLAIIFLIVSISLESGFTHYISSGNLSSFQMDCICVFCTITASLIAFAGWRAILYFNHSNYLSEPGFLPASFLFFLGVLLTTYFTALFYTKKEFVPQLPRFEIRAASIDSSAGYLCYYCYTILIFRNEYKIPLKEFLLIRKSDINRILLPIRIKPPEPLIENPFL